MSAALGDVLERWAAAATAPVASGPELRSHGADHALDTFGACLASARSSLGADSAAQLAGWLDERVAGRPDAQALRLLGTAVACTRLTECDDIYLGACVTPGSVVFPALLGALSLAERLPERSWLADVVAGYEVAIGAAQLVNGAFSVYKGIWPTLLAGPATVAAVLARTLGLDESGARRALLGGLSLGVDAVSSKEGAEDSRWVRLAKACVDGAVSAIDSAGGGVDRREVPTTEQVSGRLVGLLGERGVPSVAVSPQEEDGTPGRALLATGFKPFVTGRQGLNALEAFRQLVASESFEAEKAESIEVRVASECAPMIRRPMPAKSRSEAFGIAYQLACAAYHPDDLYDFERVTVHTDARTVKLTERVQVEGSDELSKCYPRQWPGEALVSLQGGATRTARVDDAPGDPSRPLSRADLRQKLSRLAGGAIADEVEPLASWCVALLGADGEGTAVEGRASRETPASLLGLVAR